MSGRLTFHGIDTYHGKTVGTLDVEVRYAESGEYRPLTRFRTGRNGRSDGSVLEGDAFRAGRYELVLDVAAYFAASPIVRFAPPDAIAPSLKRPKLRTLNATL